jgi:hypothetical protein
MATLTQGQIQAIATAAGLPDPKLMAAIAMAESGGRTDARGTVGEIGLWQINQPVHVKAHPTWTVAYLQNPVNNAYAAKTVLASQGLGAWTVYTSGAYKQFYSGGNLVSTAADAAGAAAGAINPLAGWVVDAAGNLVQAGAGIVDTGAQLGRLAIAVAKAGNWVSSPQNWVRIVYIGIGATAVVGAMLLVQEKYNLGMAKDLLGVAAKAVGGKGKTAASAAGKVAA